MLGKRIWQQITSAALILSVIFFVVTPALADELEEKQQELGNIQQQIEEQQQKAEKARNKERSVSEQLRIIQSELATAQEEFDAINDQLNNTEEQIKVNTELSARLVKKLEAQTKTLHRRMRDIYKNGQVNYIDVLFGAKDFNDFVSRMDILKKILAYDNALIKGTKADRETLTKAQAQLEVDRVKIVELRKQAAVKREQVAVRRQERQGVLNAATYERETAERAYRELIETSKQIETMIRRIQSGEKNIGGSTGTMLWPAEGEITSPFGWRVHPIFGTQRLHTGIDIGADYGDSVRAADGGVVIHSDWMGGYGNAVIIDHGNGISTLYAHNSQLLVSEGQTVAKGQTISRVGSTGYSTGPHLHFEVRQNGSPVNPLNFLP
ncbi:MAG TPA: peptidoglycan DD-metalloendopeptidase family protein [Negativicutes bacterium]|nr:peptidoglycan DD-metalloendopeptidase family protein [Negativicutes bacterium]